MSNAMLQLAYWINQSADLWWRSMGHAAVQVGMVALLGLVLVSLGKRWSSPLRYGILIVLLLKFAITPVLLLFAPNVAGDLLTVEIPVRSSERVETLSPQVVPSPSTSSSSVVVEHAASDSVPPEPSSVRQNPSLWCLVSFKGWAWLAHLTGSLVVVLWLLAQSVRLAAWVVRRSEPAPDVVQRIACEVQTELNYFKRLDVRVGAEAGSPMAFQLLRPVIVLPRRTMETLSEEELRPVLAHEAAHLRRRDPLVNIVQTLLFGIWWFHPVYWWLNRKLRAVREECCDDAVLALDAQGKDRYCQTLLDAARSCQAAVTGRVVLGFGESSSTMRQRIVRIMDPRVSKRAGLGWLAAGLLAVVILLGMPLWRRASSLDRPRPVSETRLQPTMLEALTRRLGFGGSSNLFLSDAEFAALEDCIDQARLTRHFRNGIAEFEGPSTRKKLIELHDKLTESFYPEFLLARWYEINDEPNEAVRWMAKALAQAPVVLVRKYELMDRRPLANTSVGNLGVEYRIDTPSRRNTYLVLDYVDLTTDEKGQVYLPGYDTKIRGNGVTYPDGYDIETGRHGYLSLHARYNRLPTIYAWPKDARRPATTLPTSEFYDYRDAVEAQGLTHRIGLTEFHIDRCYRAGADGQVTVSDGRHRIDEAPQTTPAFSGSAGVLDQAMVCFTRNTLKSHEILQVRVFDHRSRTLLTEYHAPAGYEYDGDSTVLLRSLGAELPERVDVWFWVTQFAPNESKQIVPARVGSQAEAGGYRAVVRALHGGSGSCHIAPRTSTITFNEPNDADAAQMQVVLAIGAREELHKDRYARIAVVTKDGQRHFNNHVIYGRDNLNVYDFPVSLSRVDHFELLPIGQEPCFYFDGVLLPQRSGEPVDGTRALEVAVETNAQPGVFTANLTDSVGVEVTVVSGRGSISHSSRGLGLDGPGGIEWWEPGGTYTDTDTHSTIVWKIEGLSTRLLKTDIVDLSGRPLEPRRGSGRSGSFYHEVLAIPVDQIQGVRVRLSRDVRL